MVFRSYIDPEERKDARSKLPRLMVEGLLLGGTGLGVLALIFEIAADAFSVAAYQTLLAIHGADGYHGIAVAAFVVLSVMLFLGIVPAYKAGAYLRPNAGGSGPLVEAIGPPKLRWLSWVGTSLFFLDAGLTIIISAISAADVTMLLFPEWSSQRILLAELYAFFIMAVLVLLGPKRAVPLFLIGGGAFTIFTILALTFVGITASFNPEWSFLTGGIVYRLQADGVVEHVVRAQESLSALGLVVIFQLFYKSMASAMLGFSGYEVIPASGKHAARPKWKVVNTALTLAAVFLIGTGIIQLSAAWRWNIPATEGYSTLLIEYEIVAVQTFGGEPLEEDQIVVTDEDYVQAALEYEALDHEGDLEEEGISDTDAQTAIDEIAFNIATARAITDRIGVSSGAIFLTLSGLLLAIILLFAQGGGYVGGAAVAANAARLGRLPKFFEDDRIGIAVIWGAAALLIPIIREVVIVEAYYAFGFVSAFMITSTTIFFVRKEVLTERGILPGSGEAKSLRFAGLRGMIASYIMGFVLIIAKTDALFVIAVFGALITILQILYSRGGIRMTPERSGPVKHVVGQFPPIYHSGKQRALDESRQRGIAALINEMIARAELVKFNVEPQRILRLVSYIRNIDWQYMEEYRPGHEHHALPEPSVQMEDEFDRYYGQRKELIADIEQYSHYGIFTFINKYHQNWVNVKNGRDASTVQKAMIAILFPKSDADNIWDEYENYSWEKLPEEIWQFSRLRYQWAKDQWPNLNDRITTIWTLQDFGLVPKDVDVATVIDVSDDPKDLRKIIIHTGNQDEDDEEQPK